jgi:ribosomal protein L11 methyltransferase
MRWAEILIETTVEAQDAVANIMTENGCAGTAMQGEAPVEVRCYLPVDDRLEDRLLDMKEDLAELPKFGLEVGNGELTINYVEEQDWAESWRQYFKTMRVGKRFVIKPTWDKYVPQRGDVLIELDPGMAFGTGSHQTTRLCLQALEKYMRPRGLVVDFGTGSGILAIAAVKLGAALVIAFDSDEIAVKAARENVLRNNTDDRTEVHQAENSRFINKQVDVVTANIVAETIIANAEDLGNLLKLGGILIASGITTGKAFDVEIALKNQGFDMREQLKEDDWVCIVAIKAN